MPFNMFKAFSGSRNRNHRGDPTIYTDFPQGYPPATDSFQPEPLIRSQSQVLRRPNTKRREPVFTPLQSHSDAEGYNEDFIRVDSPDAVMRGALNARPGKLDPALPPLGGPGLVGNPLSDTFSEREHREQSERLHDIPRLMDRPPQLQRMGSFHSGLGERAIGNPEEPIIMPHSPSRSSGSGSDHTIEALHTPPSGYPSDRVIPPFPRNYSTGYTRSPTDIYGSHAYEVVHDTHSHGNREIYLDRRGRGNGYGKDGPMYYIIPGGMDVIFQDEHGNEITRVGEFNGRPRPSRPGPFVVQDEHGREIYKYNGYDKPQIVQIDANPSNHFRRDRGYSSETYPSYKRGYSHYPDFREHRDYSDQRDHRHRVGGYGDYPDHSNYKDHRRYRDSDRYREFGDHRDHVEYREHGGVYGEHSGYREPDRYRGHDGYGQHGEYRVQGRHDLRPPSRVSSRASHRTHNSRMSMERPFPQYAGSFPDDGRSGVDYTSPHTSIRHPEDEIDLSGGLQALHI